MSAFIGTHIFYAFRYRCVHHNKRLFNYKKRLLDISGNLPLSIVLGFLLTFDSEGLVACQLIKDPQVSMITFFAAALFILFVQPAIIAIIPSKEN